MKPGDTVRFLNDIGGGKISRIEGKTAYVTDSDGFETPVLLTQCVVVPSAEPDKAPAAKESKPKFQPSAPAAVPAPARREPRQKATGFNVCLLFEPQDIKRLSATKFDVYLVNDSNYSLLFTVSTRDRLDSRWTLLASGEAEPGTQEFLVEIMPTDLNRFENISVQLLAFSAEESFEMKAPIAMSTRFDVTRLAKLHCFTPTAYSPSPVLTLPVKSYREELEASAQPAPLKNEDSARPSKSKSAHSGSRKPDEPEVVDLHIHELLDSTAGMEPADMLAYQLDVFDKKMKEAARRPGSKIVFIHGKGEGVLRKAILDRLRKQWPKSEAQDASFLEYGFGATQITVRR